MARLNRHRRIGVLVAAHWIGLLAFSMAPAGALAGQTEPNAEEVVPAPAPARAPAATAEERVQAEASAAGTAEQSAQAEASVDGSDAAPEALTTIRGDVFRVGGPVRIARDERVRGDATVILGPLTVDGEVIGDIVVIAGLARFGPDAVVRGDVTVVAGSLQQAPSAALRGSVTQVGLGSVRGYTDSGRWWRFGWPGGGWLGAGDLVGTGMRLLFLALLASGIVLVARGPVERIARRASAEPIKAGVVGMLAQMLVVPLLVSGILVLVISIVGIPLLLLLPFVVMAVVLLMLVGFSGGVLGAGESIRSRMGASSSAAHASVWAGVALISCPPWRERRWGWPAGSSGAWACCWRWPVSFWSTRRGPRGSAPSS